MQIVGHLDMDAFYAAVEERGNPQYKGKPIVVGADPKEGEGRGVVSTANYKARKYKINSAQPISQAWKNAQKAKKEGEEVVFLPVDMGKYEEVSTRIMDIVREKVDTVEQVSVDEAYMDLTKTGSWNKAKNLCQEIKEEIEEKEKLTSSIGIGPNKLIAKIASDLKKPDGLNLIKEEEAKEKISNLTIRKIPGVGPKTEKKLNKKGIETIKDLRQLTQKELKQMFGKVGLDIYDKARARDDSPVLSKKPKPKSIGEQETFQEDTKDPGFVFGRLKSLCRNVIKRFHSSEFRHFKTVVVTVRFGDFETKTRTHTREKPASSLNALQREALKLMLPFLDNRKNPEGKPVRLIGVRIEKLE